MTKRTWMAALAMSALMGCAGDEPDDEPGLSEVASALNAAPATITSLVSTPTAMRLSFTTQSGLAGVRLLRMDRAVGAYVRYATLAIDPSSSYVFDDTAAVTGHEYCYIVVTSLSGQTTGTNSAPACAQHGGPPLPAAPSGFISTGASERSLSFQFTDASSDETSFVVERSGFAGYLPVFTLAPSPGTGTVRSFSVADLDSELDHCFRVRAVSANGTSAGVVACRRTLAALSWEPVANIWGPDIFAITHPGPGQLTIQWMDGSTQSSWVIEAYDGLSTGTIMFSGNASDNRVPRPQTQAYTLSNLEPGRLYCFRINRAGSKSPKVCESPRAARTADDQREPRPSATPVLAAVVSAGNTRLRLDINNPQPDQMVERISTFNSVRTTFLKSNASSTITDAELISGRTYCYRIWAFNTFGSRYGDIVCGTTSTDPPLPPTNLRVVSVDTEHLVMAWDAGTNAERYDLEWRGTRSGFGTHDASDWTSGLSLSLFIFEGYNYCVKVRSRNEFGVSAWVERCNITTPDDHLTTYSGRLQQQTATTTFLHTVSPGSGPPATLVSVVFEGSPVFTQYKVLFQPPGRACPATTTAGAVIVEPGETLSGAGLATLYGAAEPALPLTLVACKLYPPDMIGDLDPIPITVTYRR
jgi:hypothetical protein